VYIQYPADRKHLIPMQYRVLNDHSSNPKYRVHL
jgi:hypothetical protein